MTKKYTPRKIRNPNAKERAMAAHLIAGDNPSKAARKAGYAESVVRSQAARMARRETVRLAMIEQGQGINVVDLGSMAKVKVQEGLTKLKTNRKEGKLALGYARTAGEMSGLLGGPSELHLHNHQQLSPTAARMVAEMVIKLQNERDAITESGITIREQEKPLLSETVQPEPISPPANEIPQEPRLTFQEKQDRYVAFQAGLVNPRRI